MTGAVFKEDWFSGLLRDGCSVSESCFTCPLPACRYELKSNQAAALAQVERFRSLTAAGKTVEDAGREMGISRRTAYRLWKTVRPS